MLPPYLFILLSSLSLLGEALPASRPARQANRETIVASTVATVIGDQAEVSESSRGNPDPNIIAQACTAADCSERGTCFGTKATPLCLCQLGFAGRNCQDSMRESSHGRVRLQVQII